MTRIYFAELSTILISCFGQAVKVIDALVNLGVELLDFGFNRGEVGAAGFLGDGFHQIADGAEIVAGAGAEINQRFERVDEQRINRLRLFAFGPLLLARVFVEELPPACVNELAQRLILERQAQDRERARLAGRLVGDAGGKA